MAYNLNDDQSKQQFADEPKSLRDRIRTKARQLPRETVEVPEWDMIGDDAIVMQAMTGTARDAYEAEIVGNRAGKDRRLNLSNLRARLVARCMIDPATGDPIFDWRKPQDVDELGSYNAAGLDRLFKVAQQLNGITDEDVEALEKNSQVEANGVSGLSSH